MPVTDARTLPDASRIEADLIIIGGGDQGRTVAGDNPVRVSPAIQQEPRQRKFAATDGEDQRRFLPNPPTVDVRSRPNQVRRFADATVLDGAGKGGGRR